MTFSESKIHDNFLKGYFCIECIDKNGKVTDKFEKHNLITNIARREFAKLVAGITSTGSINRFVMGTQGHVGDDVLTPKDQDTGFNASLTNIFSGTNDDDLNKTWNQITFTPSGNLINTEAQNIVDGANNNSTVDIKVVGLETNEPMTTYTINIAQDAFNGISNGIIYTECGLYIDENLIAMRTFKGKVKDDSVALRITWNLIF